MTVSTSRSSSEPSCAVIIPHFNDVPRLARCLDALTAQNISNVEIVVVDNGSSMSLDPALSGHAEVRVVSEAASGAAPARNRGVVETSAPALIFLDADCVPAADWLDQAKALAPDAVETGEIFGGRIDVFDETPRPRSGAEAFETVFAFDQRAYVEQKGFSVTANLITSRATFEDVGPFRAGVSEDLDWCHRATGKGHALRYIETLAVSHPSRSDWDALRKKWRRLTTEAFGLRGKGFGSRIEWMVRALAMPVSVPVHAPAILTCHSLSTLEKARGLSTLVRLRMLRMGWMLLQAATNRP